jgi:hypothetical protein
MFSVAYYLLYKLCPFHIQGRGWLKKRRNVVPARQAGRGPEAGRFRHQLSSTMGSGSIQNPTSPHTLNGSHVLRYRTTTLALRHRVVLIWHSGMRFLRQDNGFDSVFF